MSVIDNEQLMIEWATHLRREGEEHVENGDRAGAAVLFTDAASTQEMLFHQVSKDRFRMRAAVGLSALRLYDRAGDFFAVSRLGEDYLVDVDPIMFPRQVQEVKELIKEGPDVDMALTNLFLKTSQRNSI